MTRPGREAKSINTRCHRGINFPAAGHMWTALRLGAGVSLWFLLVYGGADWLTGLHDWRVPIAAPWEQAIPFVPWAVLGYMALYPLFLLAPCVLTREDELRQFARTLFVLIGLSGVIFVALPSELAYDRPPSAGAWRGIVQLADLLNLDYNCVPSLHVGFSVVCAAVFVKYVGRTHATLLWIWASAVALSTLLTHQHHVIDVATGWTLALVCAHYGYQRPLASARTRSTPSDPNADGQAGDSSDGAGDPNHPPGPGEKRIVERSQGGMGRGDLP